LNAEALYNRAPPWGQNILFNAHAGRISLHRYGFPFRRTRRWLTGSEFWSAEVIQAYQDRRIRAIVTIAYQHSPYYQDLFNRCGLSPEDIRGRHDLVKLPVLTKDAIRNSERSLLTARRPRVGWLNGHTSGTTGSPLSVWYDRTTCIWTNAVDSRHKLWVGIRDTDWLGLLLGRVIVPPTDHRPPFWRVNRVHRQVWFSSFHLNDRNLPEYVREMRRRQLRFLEGYPSTLFILAEYLLRVGERLPLEAVITSSETLHPIQRDTIEQAFECQLFDFYALAERVVYAGECAEHAGKHLAEEYGFAEVVDDENNPLPAGEMGYLVGTSLHNTAMPLLRYRTGDVTSLENERCACGRSSRRLTGVATKAEDIVITPDGRKISPSVLTHPFKPFPQITKSQIIQESLTFIRVRVVPSSQFGQHEENLLLAGLKARLGEGIRIELDRVSDIPQEPSGKYRWVISNLDHSTKVDWGSSDPAS
jgi:phenylacetate-CoA ligase